MSPRALAGPLSRLTKPVLDKRGRAFAALVGEWAQIIGPALAPSTLPEKLTTGPTSAVEPGGVLTLRVAGAAALEIQHLAPQILERLNAFLGYTAVSRLKLVQAPLPLPAAPPAPPPRPLTGAEKREIKAATAGVEDEGLRAALEGLGQAMLAGSPPIRR
jgi:hypothetical protein